MDAVLVINAGSSSLKFAVFHAGEGGSDAQLHLRGHVAAAAAGTELLVTNAAGQPVGHTPLRCVANRFDQEAALGQVVAWLGANLPQLHLFAVGHRVVHGGARHRHPIVITPAVLAYLQSLVPLAPLHQPHSLNAVEVLAQVWPRVTQVACFDTAFHSTQPPVEQAFALPRRITEAGVRRYGFHGLSYEYVAARLPHVLGPDAGGKVIAAHLGNGASLCAMLDGVSMASTMGFSALDGLPMGTRCGALDAGVVLHLLQELHMSPQETSDLLYKQSGLLGVSGISSDMRTLLRAEGPRAAEAVDLFVHRIAREIGALAACLGGLDALVFTAGIGEHASSIRARVASRCAWLGVELDAQANERGDALIHAASSRVRVAIVPTDEERMIALHTLACGAAT